MSEAKYIVINGDTILGVLWENESLGKVFVTDGKIDLNFDLEIRDFTTGENVKNVDLREFILDVIPEK